MISTNRYTQNWRGIPLNTSFGWFFAVYLVGSRRKPRETGFVAAGLLDHG